MNRHLQLVREYHQAFQLPQAEFGANERLSDMDIIMRQALLMEEGSRLLKALKSGDMVKILAGLTDLAYCALGAIALQGGDVQDRPVVWHNDGYVVSLMRLLSDKINACSDGDNGHYSEVYNLCLHLARDFINADFDKSMQRIHDSKLSHLKASDLSDCLYE